MAPASSNTYPPERQPASGPPAVAPHDARAGASSAMASSRLIDVLLFIAILGSPFVFIEPAPYEALVLVLGAAAVALGLRVHRLFVPLIVLLVVWAVGGLLATMPVLHDGDALKHYLVTFYLEVTTVLFAGLFAVDTMRRLATLRAAYILAAVIVAAVGSLAYFGMIPGSETLMEYGRVRGTFKDPNVFGPFLILPLLLITQSVIGGRLRVAEAVAALIILVGLLLSFSRGAWGHFAFSFAVMIVLLFLTESSARRRARMVGMVTVLVVMAVGLLAFLLSLGAVQEMFEIRANLVQSYDAGAGGRFAGQSAGLAIVVEEPNGLGPRQFSKEMFRTTFFAADPHNVYIAALLAYGWLGGAAYIMVVLSTLYYGCIYLFRRSPWQPFMIAVYATFLGLALEGMIIDTDHWRHFYLVVGVLWGLMAATAKQSAPSPAETPRHAPVALSARA